MKRRCGLSFVGCIITFLLLFYVLERNVDAFHLLRSSLKSQSSISRHKAVVTSLNSLVEGSKSEISGSRNKIVAPIFDEKCEMTGITLSRFLVETVIANPNLRELESLLVSVQIACKTIASVVERAHITGMTGLQAGGGSVNIQGEEQKRLDIITNDILTNALRFSGKCGVIASEEVDSPMQLGMSPEEKYKNKGLVTTQFNDAVPVVDSGKYVTVFDPLDGSSNVDAGIPTGTIFGVFEENPNAECDFLEDPDSAAQCMVDTLQAGRSLVAAGYCLYSSSTFFCLTLGNGVNIFTLDRSIGEFILTHPDVQIPKRGKIYSFNEANRWGWDRPLKDYVTDIQKGLGETKQAYAGRYIGSMVGDVHRTLMYGGVFGYPATTKNKNGKLRLLYEAAPMSFLIEQAGGLSTTGKERIMDILPADVHQRVPCIMGSPDDVKELLKYYDKWDEASTDASTLSADL